MNRLIRNCVIGLVTYCAAIVFVTYNTDVDKGQIMVLSLVSSAVATGILLASGKSDDGLEEKQMIEAGLRRRLSKMGVVLTVNNDPYQTADTVQEVEKRIRGYKEQLAELEIKSIIDRMDDVDRRIGRHDKAIARLDERIRIKERKLARSKDTEKKCDIPTEIDVEAELMKRFVELSRFMSTADKMLTEFARDVVTQEDLMEWFSQCSEEQMREALANACKRLQQTGRFTATMWIKNISDKTTYASYASSSIAMM